MRLIKVAKRPRARSSKARYYRSLGERIFKARQRLQMSQATLARKSRMSVGFLCDVENGKRGITAFNLIRLAKPLRITPHRLLGNYQEATKPQEQQS